MAKLLSKTEIDKNIIMHVEEVEDTLYKCNTFNNIHVEEVEDIRFECNALSSTHVGDVEDLKILTM